MLNRIQLIGNLGNDLRIIIFPPLWHGLFPCSVLHKLGGKIPWLGGCPLYNFASDFIL